MSLPPRFEKLKELEATLDKLPWEVIGDSVFGTYSRIRRVRSHWPIVEVARDEDHLKHTKFIAEARNRIPDLLKAIEIAYKALNKIQDECEGYSIALAVDALMHIEKLGEKE